MKLARWVEALRPRDVRITFVELEARERGEDVGRAIGELEYRDVLAWTIGDALAALPKNLFDEAP
jgi:hypothetical protein